MPKVNEITLPCKICGRPTTASSDTRSITCADCVATGEQPNPPAPVKSFFKDEKMNQTVAKTTSAEMKPEAKPEAPKPAETKEKKNVSRIDFVKGFIAKGLTNEQIIAEIIKAGYKTWWGDDSKKAEHIEAIRNKK